MRPQASVWILSAVLLILLSGCGLEVVPFLSAPIVTSVNEGDTAPEFEFENDPDSDPDLLRGFELYYKFYDPNPSVYLDAYDADIAVIEGQFTSSPTTVLSGRGFRRINHGALDSSGSLQLPLLPVDVADRSIAFTVTVKFPGDGVNPAPGIAQYLSFTELSAVELVRSATNSLQEFLSFTPTEIQPADTDVPSLISDTDGIAVGLVAIAFGRDSTSFPARALYSEPVGLGVASLN